LTGLGVWACITRLQHRAGVPSGLTWIWPLEDYRTAGTCRATKIAAVGQANEQIRSWPHL
jgi:hypothetical protein